MKKQKVVTLDLSGCQSLGEIHQRIKKAFAFPDFYGENWSAFWDLLWSECDADRIVVLGLGCFPEKYQWHIDKMQEILQRPKEHRAKYDEQIEIELHS